MDFRKLGEEIVAKAIKGGAGEAEACLENVRSFEVNVRKGEIETLTRSVSRGLGLVEMAHLVRRLAGRAGPGNPA